MLNFGEQLYRLTQRDEETLLLDFQLTQTVVTVGAGITNAFVDMQVPRDRALYVHRLTVYTPGAALSVPTGFSWQAVVAGVPVGDIWAIVQSDGLKGDRQISTLTAGLEKTWNLDYRGVLPPGLNYRFRATRTNSTNPVQFFVSMHGYLIPPGRIGRA